MSAIEWAPRSLQVPVGGAILAGGKVEKGEDSLVDVVNKAYPGRASMAPLLDMLITLLSMGDTGESWHDGAAIRRVRGAGDSVVSTSAVTRPRLARRRGRAY